MGERRIILTRHATETMVNLDIGFEEIRKTILEGERMAEDRSKTRYTLRTKRGLMVAICREFPDETAVITVTVTRRRR